ncbi:MAG: hypothetical protein IKH88_02510 [Prevotella sp.]|nr:hypothetical protein [Prevotella sp.]
MDHGDRVFNPFLSLLNMLKQAAKADVVIAAAVRGADVRLLLCAVPFHLSFFAILVFVDNEILARIFARNVLRISFLLFARQLLYNIVFTSARDEGESCKHRQGTD